MNAHELRSKLVVVLSTMALIFVSAAMWASPALAAREATALCSAGVLPGRRVARVRGLQRPRASG